MLVDGYDFKSTTYFLNISLTNFGKEIALYNFALVFKNHEDK
jgi:hypothetical protein